MILHKSSENLRKEVLRLKSRNLKIGFVPTMGALHKGHLSLVQRAKAENDAVICSIFVNPKQFNDPADLEKYPKPIQHDMELLYNQEVDFLFLPEYDDLYGEGYKDDDLDLGGLDLVLEGEQRPGHFQGMAKVVKRFFEIVQPNRAYFGQKDFQQSVIVANMVQNYNLNVDVVVCPILREEQGLAMSSRNIRLSQMDRERASFVYKSLLQLKERCYFKSLAEALDTTLKYLNSIEDAELEYLACVNGESLIEVENLDAADYVVALIVVKYKGVRLLDNLVLKDSR